MWHRMLRLFAALHRRLHGIHRLVQGPHIEANLQCEQSPHLRIGHRQNQARTLMYLRVYGLLVVGRHKPRGLLVRPDRGGLNLLDQLYLVLVFFLSRKKANNRIHNLRGQSQAPPPHRRNRQKIRTPLPK